MKLGFSPMSGLIFDLEQAYRLADALNLQFVELAYDLQELAPTSQEAKRVLQLSRATGIGTTVHLSYIDLNLASLIPAARTTSVERTKRGLAYAAEIEASCAVLHSGRHYYRHPLADELARSAMHQSLEALKSPPVPIALENLALDEHDFIREPEELLELTDKFGFANCLDFGHANVESNQAWRPLERQGEDLTQRYLEMLGERIVHLHLHNNDGHKDLHRPTSQGNIDYRKYRDFLRGFSGTICLEIVAGEEGVRESVRHLREVVGD